MSHSRVLFTSLVTLLVTIGFTAGAFSAPRKQKEPTPQELAEDKAFAENVENLTNCYYYLKDFSDLNDSEKVINMAPTALSIIALAETTVSNLDAAIEIPSQFQRRNENAQSIFYGSMMSWTKGYIKKAKDKIQGMKVELSKSIKRDVEWLAMPEADFKYAPGAMEKISKSFDLLDKFFPGDKDVEALKKSEQPKAKKNYDKLLAKVASSRMPAAKMTDAGLEASLKAAYIERYTDADVKRVVIVDSGWVTKTELKDDNQTMRWVTSQYISAQVAVVKGSAGTVYPVTFRKTADGKIECASFGVSYPILPANISK